MVRDHEDERDRDTDVFEREGESGFISIVASELSDGPADPEWQHVQFSFSDFERNVQQFLMQLQAHIKDTSVQYGPHWWTQVVEPAA